MDTLERDLNTARSIALAAAERGGTVYYVGGCVRDRLMGAPVKDVDIEVHGVAPEILRELLDGLGERLTVGESFGVYNLKGCSLDIAMPRRETASGRGHRDFEIDVDPFIGTYRAAIRRDFTVNAMMQNVLTGQIVDHFGGQEDLRRGVLRHVSGVTFAEDPLRVLRGAQFAARFGFAVAEETVELCRGMALDALPRERVMGELEKALLKADRPSVFFSELRRMEQLSTWFPELEALIGVEQNPRFHTEGDVWTHTLLVLDAAAAYRDRASDPLAFMLSALTHDMGKAVCTERVNGELHAYGHETAGLPLAERFIRRLTAEKDVLRYVLNMTEHHMRPSVAAGDRSSVKSTNRMFDRSADPEGLICLALADGLGTVKPGPRFSNEGFLYDRLRIYRETMARPFVEGKDLLAAGLAPGPEMGEFLAYAHKLRLAGVEKPLALKQTLAYAEKYRRKHER